MVKVVWTADGLLCYVILGNRWYNSSPVIVYVTNILCFEMHFPSTVIGYNWFYKLRNQFKIWQVHAVDFLSLQNQASGFQTISYMGA